MNVSIAFYLKQYICHKQKKYPTGGKGEPAGRVTEMVYQFRVFLRFGKAQGLFVT